MCLKMKSQLGGFLFLWRIIKMASKWKTSSIIRKLTEDILLNACMHREEEGAYAPMHKKGDSKE